MHIFYSSKKKKFNFTFFSRPPTLHWISATMPGGKGKEGLRVTFAVTTQKTVTNKKAVAVYGLLRLILKKNLIGNSSSTRQNMRLACVLGIVQLVK